ncbi:MAG: DUF5717 family protein [Roseburia faecis]
MEEREQDEELLLLCTSAFLNKKYNDRILQYLSDFYSGPVETMLRLWRAAQDFELRTRDLEERILEQMLYTDMDLLQALEVFAHYYESGGQELIVLCGHYGICAELFCKRSRAATTNPCHNTETVSERKETK